MNDIVLKLTIYLRTHFDKVLHFTAGMIVFLVMNIIAPIHLAIFVAIFVGAFKEVFDLVIRGQVFDKWDWFWTAIGGLFAGILVYLKNIFISTWQ
jgi:hypothetical protein